MMRYVWTRLLLLMVFSLLFAYLLSGGGALAYPFFQSPISPVPPPATEVPPPTEVPSPTVAEVPSSTPLPPTPTIPPPSETPQPSPPEESPTPLATATYQVELPLVQVEGASPTPPLPAEEAPPTPASAPFSWARYVDLGVVAFAYIWRICGAVALIAYLVVMGAFVMGRRRGGGK